MEKNPIEEIKGEITSIQPDSKRFKVSETKEMAVPSELSGAA
jgi:hypothetical protein